MINAKFNWDNEVGQKIEVSALFCKTLKKTTQFLHNLQFDRRLLAVDSVSFKKLQFQNLTTLSEKLNLNLQKVSISINVLLRK